MKKNYVFGFFFFAFSFSLFAQQITKFAVVDTTRVYTAYFRDSSAVRNYEAKKAEFQAEIDRLTNELKNLQIRKTDLLKNGDNAAAMRIEADMNNKTSYLTEYTKAKNIELDNIKKRLENSDDFYILLYTVLGKIAESDGYSLVLSLQQANAILWYSQSVDITDKVITTLAQGR